MSMTPSESLGQNLRSQDPGLERRGGSDWPSGGLLLTGLAVVAVGALAWYYLGPDLVRYMKIREM